MRQLLFLILLIGGLGHLSAQVSGNCVSGISTDPDNPIKANPSDPVYHENTFDWRQAWFPVVLFCSNPDNRGIASPFWNRSALWGNERSDFEPSDGWELINRNLGYMMEPGQMDDPPTATRINRTFAGPYIILYNRYRGLIRVLGALPFVTPSKGVLITLNLPTDPSRSYEGYTHTNGLFSQHSRVAQPLDQETGVQTLGVPAYYPGGCNDFFFADFQVAYDPCVCEFESLLEVQFDWIEDRSFGTEGGENSLARETALRFNQRLETYRPSGSFISLRNQTRTRIDTLQQGSMLGLNAWPLFKEQMEHAEAELNFPLASAFYYLATAARVGVEPTKQAALAPIVAVDGEEATVRFGGLEESLAFKASVITVGLAQSLTLDKALEIAAPHYDFLAAQFETDSTTRSSSIARETGHELKGVAAYTSLESFGVQLGVPGAKGSHNLPELLNPPLPAYPTYNEALGVFSVLRTPTMNQRVIQQSSVEKGVEGDCQKITRTRYEMRLKETISYAVNPAAGIDTEASSLRVAVLINMEIPEGITLDSLENLEAIVPDGRITSAYMPLNCLENVRFSMDFTFPSCQDGVIMDLPEPTVSLKFLNTYVSELPGSKGDFVESRQVLSYAVTTEEVDSVQSSPVIPFDLEISGQLTSDQRAWHTITLDSDTRIVGMPELRAGHEVSYPAWLQGISESQVFTGADAVLPCGPANMPMAAEALATYCRGGGYKANLAYTAAESISEGESGIPVQESGLLVYPNPTEGFFVLSYEAEQGEEVWVTLYDLTGRQVLPAQVAVASQDGKQETCLEAHNIPVGIYQAVVRMEDQRLAAKVFIR